MRRFYLGTDNPTWLRQTTTPLCVTVNRILRYETWPRAKGPWVCDPNAFTNVSKHGRHLIAPETLAGIALKFMRWPGRLEWVAIQDYMCEPDVLAVTGLDIITHQRLTVASYIDLMRLAPAAPWLPVLQGFKLDEYLRCVDLYYKARIYLHELPVVGVGSICRRQATREAEAIIRRLKDEGLRLHGFGMKIKGLENVGEALYSADSMAWSFHTRMAQIKLEGCNHKSPKCSHCLRYALGWHERVSKKLLKEVA